MAVNLMHSCGTIAAENVVRHMGAQCWDVNTRQLLVGGGEQRLEIRSGLTGVCPAGRTTGTGKAQLTRGSSRRKRTWHQPQHAQGQIEIDARQGAPILSAGMLCHYIL